MSQQMRTALEQRGYTFHAGSLVSNEMQFEFKDKTIDSKPSPVSKLNAYGWILVDGGIMEPPKPGVGQTVLRFAAIGAVLFGIVKTVDYFRGEN